MSFGKRMKAPLTAMRIALALLFLLGVGGLLVIPALRVAQPHSMLDAILPARVLESTTADERMHIADKLRDRYTLDPLFPMLGAGLVATLSGVGLWLGFMRTRKLAATPGPQGS